MDHSLEFRLLNEFQRDFPLCPAPYAELACRLGVAERAVIGHLEKLRRDGRISRIGPVFSPRRFGASTLAAMAVPPERLAAVAATVSRFVEVNHNYQREHRYNLWFVVTAASPGRLQAVLGAIEQAAGHPLMALPLLEEFHIDLGFPLDGRQRKRQAISQARHPGEVLGEADRRLVSALQEGLPLFLRPFALIAEHIGATEAGVLERIRQWLENGAIRRFGIVVRHWELGYSANAMVVHDIPDALASGLGRALAEEPALTLCYRRPRHPPDWPYNLFFMIHGCARQEVEETIAAVRRRHGLDAYPHAVLFSVARFKQTGARYA